MRIDRQKVWEKCEGHCGYCGEAIAINDMQVDHIWPQNRAHQIPGLAIHDHKNLMPACRVCNNWKSTYTVELFRLQIIDQVKQLRQRSANYRMAKRYGLIEETGLKVVFYFENRQTAACEMLRETVRDVAKAQTQTELDWMRKRYGVEL